MRERLVLTLVAMTVGILVVFGVVRAYSTADLVHDQHVTKVEQAADLMSVAIAAREQGGEPVTAEFLSSLAGQERVVVFVDAQGVAATAGGADTAGDDIRASRSVEGGGRLTVSEPDSIRSGEVSDALLPLVLLGLGLAVVAAVVGSLLARRLARPFRRLADDAARIGEGSFDVEIRHSSISEAETLGNALRSAAGQLDILVTRERELATVASHELRTPITALRLSLEDLSLWPQTPPDVADELRRGLVEVDRLTDVVTALLERGDGSHLGSVAEVDLAVLAAEAVDRWSGRASAGGRAIILGRSGPVHVRVVRTSADRVLDALVENALLHGSGAVTVDAVLTDTYAGVRVSDEGPRAFPSGVLHESPSGGGLTGAATQAESLGGFIGVHDDSVTRVVLALPRPPSGLSGEGRP